MCQKAPTPRSLFPAQMALVAKKCSTCSPPPRCRPAAFFSSKVDAGAHDMRERCQLACTIHRWTPAHRAGRYFKVPVAPHVVDPLTRSKTPPRIVPRPKSRPWKDLEALYLDLVKAYIISCGTVTLGNLLPSGAGVHLCSSPFSNRTSNRTRLVRL